LVPAQKQKEAVEPRETAREGDSGKGEEFSQKELELTEGSKEKPPSLAIMSQRANKGKGFLAILVFELEDRRGTNSPEFVDRWTFSCYLGGKEKGGRSWPWCGRVRRDDWRNFDG